MHGCGVTANASIGLPSESRQNQVLFSCAVFLPLSQGPEQLYQDASRLFDFLARSVQGIGSQTFHGQDLAQDLAEDGADPVLLHDI
jgi:hypothetical protein